MQVGITQATVFNRLPSIWVITNHLLDKQIAYRFIYFAEFGRNEWSIKDMG